MCDVCAHFERQIRDLETEIEGLGDQKGEKKAELSDRLESAIHALTEAKALYEHHRRRKHP